MAIVHTKSRTKPTGGKRRLHRKKKNFDMGSPFVPATVGETRRKKLRVMGGNSKVRLLKVNEVNISKGKKVVKAKIKQVAENPSNPFFVRRNIVTKGAIIETDKGYARVTSRPGQDGQINAVELKGYEPEKKTKKKKKQTKQKKTRKHSDKKSKKKTKKKK